MRSISELVNRVDYLRDNHNELLELAAKCAQNGDDITTNNELKRVLHMIVWETLDISQELRHRGEFDLADSAVFGGTPNSATEFGGLAVQNALGQWVDFYAEYCRVYEGHVACFFEGAHTQ